MSDLMLILKLLPELIALIKSVQKAIDAAQVDRKVKDDLQALQKAIDSKDATAINHIFNS